MISNKGLPVLPDGWEWRNCLGTWSAHEGITEVSAGTQCVELSQEDVISCPLSVLAAVLFANSVTLPEIPGHSTILGGK